MTRKLVRQKAWLASGPPWRRPAAYLALVSVIASVAAPLGRQAIRKSGAPAKPSAAIAVTVAELRDLVSKNGAAIFWAGPKPGDTYEYTRTSAGRVFIRYLPPHVAVGSSSEYLTIGTYPVPNAYATLLAVSKTPNAVIVPAATGLALYQAAAPNHVYLSYPGLDDQIEVFDPTPGDAEALVASGAVVPVAVPIPASG